MQFNDVRISRHDIPEMVKVEFVADENTIVVSMRGGGLSDCTDS